MTMARAVLLANLITIQLSQVFEGLNVDYTQPIAGTRH